ncbi:MAG: nucleotide exchange factor GrpE [Clostridia bacterium]|nr:nucleotide exchange factor GrpE [Clostridia bacterium]
MEQQQNSAEEVKAPDTVTENAKTAESGEQIEIQDANEQAAGAENAEAKADTQEPTQEEWAKALTDTVKERDDYKDRYLRAQAEFQNYKRRTALTRWEAYEDGVRETISALLPSIDNLELALKHAETAQDSGALTQGVSMTLKLMMDALGKLGLEEVPALGEEFDPEKHNAVMREPGGEENRICEVFQKGYKVHDRMIRYAMVKVYSGAEA